MSNLSVDLSNCERELIHIPGQIQSHGFLIVVDDEYIIRFFSDNISKFIPAIKQDIFGEPLHYLERLLGTPIQTDFIVQLLNIGRANKNFDQTNPFQLDIFGTSFYLIISAAGNYFSLEFESVLSDLSVDVHKMIGYSITQMLADKKLLQLLNNSATQVKNIINYDRVMIYRFAEDGHGEVVAEAKNDMVESWLGLHYPASDIPKQARELYKLNLTRLIADVNNIPSKIITEAANREPLDLTNAQLRAVSPIHIQYLKNMAVASSYSISLLYKNELWGLIACHNYTPRFIDYKSRQSSKLIGQILSSALEYRQDEENLQLNQLFKNNLDILSKKLLKSNNIIEALTEEHINLLDVVNATGAAILYEKNITKIGITPDDEEITDIINWIKENNTESFYQTNNLSAVYPNAIVYKHIASGVLLFVLSKELEEYVMWFKPEVLQTITWAGNPDKPVEILPDGYKHISPRHSFSAWSENVSATSEKWSIEEIKSATRLKEEIIYDIHSKAGAIRALNEKLRQAYEELDTFSYTISHDLKNPITAIKGYAQVLAMDKTLNESTTRVLYRISERADKMNLMINAILEHSHISRSDIEFKKINMYGLLHDIIKDLDVEKSNSNFNITVGETPDIYGNPVMISQVFSNLLGNAVKYSRNVNPAAIFVGGEVKENEMVYVVKDNGIGIPDQDLPFVFELFNRMDNVKDIEGSGVGLAIVKRIIEKHNGKIWVESELGKGSVFTVVFNKDQIYL
jgi:chemotaxis family two-component system sensor kinase Cph1